MTMRIPFEYLPTKTKKRTEPGWEYNKDGFWFVTYDDYLRYRDTRDKYRKNKEEADKEFFDDHWPFYDYK